MEQCFNHMSDWWLLGTNDTSAWASTGMWWGGADLCNVYVSYAAGAGMAGLVLIILVLVRCFSYLGLALKTAADNLPESVGLLWCCGCVLFAHVCTFFSNTAAILAQPAPAEPAEAAAEAAPGEMFADGVAQ
jgi:hypothetical protein